MKSDNFSLKFFWSIIECSLVRRLVVVAYLWVMKIIFVGSKDFCGLLRLQLLSSKLLDFIGNDY